MYTQLCARNRFESACLIIQGLESFTPGVPLTVEATRANGEKYSFVVNHTFNENQINWFKHGSALNAMAAASASA